jgi:phosphoribosylformylglycinamidine synthase
VGAVPGLHWFSESASRVVVVVDASRLDAVVARAGRAGVPAIVVGAAGGDRIVAQGAFDVSLAAADGAWRGALPRLLARDGAASA